MIIATLVRCQRCGNPCQTLPTSKPDARPFRRAAKRGLCAACIVCDFLQDTKHGVGHALPADLDPAALRAPHLQAQFAWMLQVGGSELTADQIDWEAVIAKWNLAEVGR